MYHTEWTKDWGSAKEITGQGEQQKSTSNPEKITSNSSVLIIPGEVEEFFNKINEEYIVYANGGEGIKNLIIEFSNDDTLSYENEAKGLCDKSGDVPKIILYRYDWMPGPSFDYQKSYYQKIVSIYHSIGHCVFNKPHNDEVLPTVNFSGTDYNYPVSYMHSNFKRNMMPQEIQASWIMGLRREFWNYTGEW